ncbi:MAG: hypothetical protein WAO52_18010 [Prolixibacteraceae bacterium]
MKQLILVMGLIFLTSSGLLAQKSTGLEVKKYNSNRSFYIPESSKIQVIKNGVKYKGKLKVISDQLVSIGSDTLSLNQIQELRAKTSSSNVGGIALLAPGSFIGAWGLNVMGIGLAEGGWGFLAVFIGTPPALVGVTGAIIGGKLLFKGKKFNPSRWEYKLNGGEQLQVSN